MRHFSLSFWTWIWWPVPGVQILPREWCKVKKAIKCTGGTPSFLFFRTPFYFTPLPTIWTPRTGYGYGCYEFAYIWQSERVGIIIKERKFTFWVTVILEGSEFSRSEFSRLGVTLYEFLGLRSEFCRHPTSFYIQIIPSQIYAWSELFTSL